eukprot:TRINITY_DN8446_c0_g1_i1.p1 TRINITY_DN8446_c0_g1~~TRINITY_DN8446_c0_g1_i1.p1  ORF type:complete len:538 (+),score=76.39 TRINITY_DN8446_c0_g1_i1:91-1614(+)
MAQLRLLWSQIDQRFDDPIREEQYQKSLEERVRRICGIAAVVVLPGHVPRWFQIMRTKESLVDGTCYATYTQVHYFTQLCVHALQLLACASKGMWLTITRSTKCFDAECFAALFVVSGGLLTALDKYHIMTLCGEVALPGVLDSTDWLLEKRLRADDKVIVISLVIPCVALMFPIRSTTRILVMPSLLASAWSNLLIGEAWLPLLYFHLLWPAVAYGGLIQEQLSREKWLSLQQVQLQQVSLHDHYAAACALLGRLCDSVLQVDQHLTILESNRALEAMLFSRRALQGRNLKDFCADDVDFDFIHAAEPGECNMRPLRLRATDGAHFSVSCYAVRFESPGTGQRRYLLGMTESEERIVSENFQGGDSKMPPQVQILGKPSVDAESNASFASVAEQGEVSVTVEISPGLRIHASSEEFALLNDGAEVSFEALVARPDSYTRLQAWLGESVGSFLETPALNDLPISMGSKTFFAREVLLKSVSLQAEGRIFVRFQLYHLRRKKKRALNL